MSAPAGEIRVTALSVTPIKGARLQTVDAVSLGRAGAEGDRRFFVLDDRGRMVNGKVHGALQTVIAEWEAATATLSLTFPGGETVRAPVAYGETVSARFFSRHTDARELAGPFSAALSEHLGADVRVCELVAGEDRGSGVDRGYAGAVSLVSAASLRRLAAQGEVETVDARRFRMLIEVDGLPEPHGEDAWVGGAPLQVGEAAVVRFTGHVGRCLVTQRDPETGETTLPTLDLLLEYRHGLPTTEPLAFGIHGEVLTPGIVRIGDPVLPVASGA